MQASSVACFSLAQSVGFVLFFPCVTATFPERKQMVEREVSQFFFLPGIACDQAPAVKGLTAVARAEKELDESEVTEGGRGETESGGDGRVSPPLSFLLFLAVFSSLHPSLENLFTARLFGEGGCNAG